MNRGLTSASVDELLDSFGTLQSGLMPREEFDRLQNILRKDDQAVQIYVEYVAQTVALRQPHILEDEALGEPVSRRKAVHQAADDASFLWVTPRIAGVMTCLLASVMILSVCWGVEWFASRTVRPALVAFPLRQLEADQTEERRLSAGLRRDEVVRLDQGFAQFCMASGVLVNVEAPAELKFTGTNKVQLLSGKVDADVPHSAIGFCLETPSGEIVDLGTRFCVQVDKNGGTNCGVLTGSVEAFAQDAKSDREYEPLRLMEGTAVSVKSGKIQAIDHQSFVDGFTSMDNAVRGVLQCTSNLSFLREAPLQLGPQTGPLLFFEQEGVTTTGEEIVNIVSPGSYKPDEYNPPVHHLPAGLTVSSLMFFVRADEGEAIHRQGAVEIRFTYPIVGIMTNQAGLSASQSIFGHPETDYLAMGVKDRPGIEPNDVVSISEDRRTLFIQYTALIDGCRILLKTDE
ncbi:FecR family protein [Lacunimicrobium album]